MNDDLERMFRLLVTTMTARSPDAPNQPFAVGDLYQDILPYRLFRRDLGLDTNQDYEMTLLELLSGARGYLVVDERMADTLQRELAAPNPDAAVFRQFSTAQVSISSEALAGIAPAQGTGSRGPTPPLVGAAGRPETPRSGDTSGAMSASPETVVPPLSSGRLPITPAPGESCRFCGGALPEGRSLVFCPHCGQDQTVLHCQACGAELEVGWNYCTTCGRGVAPV